MAGTKRRQSLGDDPEANFWVIDDVGHRAFRLYELPAGSSGKSIEVLYGELNWKSAFSNQDPGYSIIDFDRCGFEDHVPVQQALRYGGRSLNNSNVLIGYRDVYYVLDMYDERTGGAEPIYALDLTRIPRAGRRGYSCSWTRTPSSVIK